MAFGEHIEHALPPLRTIRRAFGFALAIAAASLTLGTGSAHAEAPCRWDAIPPKMQPLDPFWMGFFDLDSATISHQTALMLDKAILVWRQLPPKCPIEIYGYTDTSGSADHNLALSRRRAEVVAAYLRGHGVDSEIRITAYGETHLLVETPDGVRESQNRRAFIIIVPNP